MVFMTDRAPLERVRKLSDGRIAAVARFARSGVYTYAGSEVGRPDLGTVSVYRPDEEVFSQDAMTSFAHQTVTFNHPSDAVTPANWKKVAVGFTGGRVARDGGYVEVPLMLADADAIAAYERGEAGALSAGYKCELVWGDGIAPDGTHYQARQTQIRGNHIALVRQGRAGSECRIGDSNAYGGSNLLTDTEQSFADGPEGRCIIAEARAKHELGHAYLGDRAPAWTEAAARSAIRTHLQARANAQAFVDSQTAGLDQMRADVDAAWRSRNFDLNGWRRQS